MTAINYQVVIRKPIPMRRRLRGKWVVAQFPVSRLAANRDLLEDWIRITLYSDEN